MGRMLCWPALCLALWIPGGALAEDLLQVYALAVANDARLQSARHQFLAASEALPQARAALLPQLSFVAERIKTDQNIVDSDNPVFAQGTTDFSTDNYTLNLTIPVFNYASWLRYTQSKHLVRQSHAELLSFEQDLILDVAERYFAVLAAQDKLAYARADKSAIGKQLEFAQVRLSRGLATATEVLEARSRYALAETNEIEAEAAIEDNLDALWQITDTVLSHLAPVEGEIPLLRPDPLDVAQWVATAEARNLRLLVLEQAVEAARREVKRQRGGHFPTLDLVGSYNNRDTGGTLFGGGSEVETKEYLLRFTLPLYQGGAVNSVTRQAVQDLFRAKSELLAQRRDVIRQTRSAYLAVMKNLKKVNALDESLHFQVKALEAKKEGFKAGVNTMLEVLDAQRELFLSRSAYAQSRYDFLLSVLQLKRVSGTLMADDLVAMNDLLKRDS